jgi:hypothetical protein
MTADFEHWLESLNQETRTEARRKLELLRTLKAPDPEQWIFSEFTEDIPQTARFLLLQRLWRSIDYWRNTPQWIDMEIAQSEQHPGGHFADAGQALKQVITAGIAREDIMSIARMVAYDTVYWVLYTINYGSDSTLSFDESIAGWILMETDGEEALTGRIVDGLYESLLSCDPSGREGRPE